MSKKLNKSNNLSDRGYEELAALLSGETNPADESSISDAADSDLRSDWEKLGKMKGKVDIDVDKAWQNVFSAISGEKEKPAAKRVIRKLSGYQLRIAASLLFIVSVGIASLFVIPARKANINFNTSANEVRKEVVLPDGSTITLNRNSRIAYNKNNWERSRKVSLTGEAFFEITPDAANPFVIKAGSGTIKVVGTSFNVKTGSNNDEVEVLVETGKVQLANSNMSSTLNLEPGAMGILKGDVAIRIENSNRNYMSWKTGKLQYDATPLRQVFSDIAKIYNIEFTTSQPEIYELQLTSVFDNRGVDTILQVLERTFNLSISGENGLFEISKN